MQPARTTAVGCEARALLARHDRWDVLACFERCAYLIENSGERVVCLAHASLGNGPLNILLETPLPERGFAALLPPPGSPGGKARVRGFALHVAGLPPLLLGGSPIWSPRPFPEYTPARLGRTVRRLAATVLPGTPLPGVAELLFPGPSTTAPSRMDRELADRIETVRSVMSRWFRGDGHRHLPLLAETLKTAVGMGRGLTPSGDDFIGGALMALHALGERESARELYRRLEPTLERGTNLISRALLDCAARGLAGEGIHDVLAQMSLDTLTPRLDCLYRMGHTSGWDTFTGIATAMSTHSEARSGTHPGTSALGNGGICR